MYIQWHTTLLVSMSLNGTLATLSRERSLNVRRINAVNVDTDALTTNDFVATTVVADHMSLTGVRYQVAAADGPTAVQDMINSISPLSVGTVTIKMAAGTYEFPISYAKYTDLEFIGDNRGMAGSWFVHGAQSEFGLAAVFNSEIPVVDIGSGRFCNIAAVGATITVTYLFPGTFGLPNTSPAFNQLVAGDTLFWVDTAGAITTRTVVSRSGNSITMSAPPPAISNGVGFCVKPNVTWVQSSVSPYSGGYPHAIENSATLTIRGVHFQIPAISAPAPINIHFKSTETFLGNNTYEAGPGMVVNIGRHVIATRPQVFMCMYWSGAGSASYTFLTSFFGTRGGFFEETCPNNLTIFACFSGCNNTNVQPSLRGASVSINHGSTCHFFSDFFNCANTAIHLRSASFCNIQSVHFYGGAVASGRGVYARQGSTISNDPIPVFNHDAYNAGGPNTGLGCRFENLAEAVNLRYGCYMRCPNTQFVGNTADFVVDGQAPGMAGAGVYLDRTIHPQNSFISFTTP